MAIPRIHRTIHTRTTTAVAVIGIAALALASCGGDDSAAPPLDDDVVADEPDTGDADSGGAGAGEPTSGSDEGGSTRSAGYFRAEIDGVEYVLDLLICRNAPGSGELEFMVAGDERTQGVLSGDPTVDSISVSWEEPFLRWRISPPADGRIDELELADGRARGSGLFADQAGTSAPGTFEVVCGEPAPAPTGMTPDQLVVEAAPIEDLAVAGEAIADIFGPEDDRRAIVTLDACAGDQAQIAVEGAGFEPGSLQVFVGGEPLEAEVAPDGTVLFSAWVFTDGDVMLMLSDASGTSLIGNVPTAGIC